MDASKLSIYFLQTLLINVLKQLADDVMPNTFMLWDAIILL